MKHMRFELNLFLFCILFSMFCDAAQAKDFFYSLKSGETASIILHRARLLPLYQKKGSIDKLAVVNRPNIQNIDKKQIFRIIGDT